MLPEPWDRNRKQLGHHHDRSEGLAAPILGGWRDSPYRPNDFSPRWGFPSDFRRAPGYGKQGGWLMYPEVPVHGYPIARSGDRFLTDDGFRSSIHRGEGRYGRFFRENRASVGHKEWRGHLETNHHRNNNHNGGLPNASARSSFLKDKKSVGDSPMRASQPRSESCDEAPSKGDAIGSDLDQKLDKENSSGSLDWKPLKWSRSGSLTSRSSGFNHSSSSKSTGGECIDLKGDLSSEKVSPSKSPSGDAVASAPSILPSEETTSRKKPRLGWGEGLAKYEKKKVEDPEESAPMFANAASLSIMEPVHSAPPNLVDKSPRSPGFSDCSSPAAESASKFANAASLSIMEPVQSLPPNLVDKSPQVPGFSDCSSPTTESAKKVANASSLSIMERVHFLPPSLVDKSARVPCFSDCSSPATESASKFANPASLGIMEPVHSLPPNSVDKSPRVPGFSDCSSPATPSSVACSSSPVLEEKVCVKTTADGDANNFSVSSMRVSESQFETLHFSLEKMELNSISNLGSLLNELLQVDDHYLTDSVFVNSSTLKNKLRLWKGDISKELELTESEIDSLENELRSLKSDSGSDCLCPVSSNSLSVDYGSEPREDINVIPRPQPLEVVSSEDMIVKETLPVPCAETRGAHTQNMDEGIDSPGTVTSKFVEHLAVQKSVSADRWKSAEFTAPAGSTRSLNQDLEMQTDVENTCGTSCQFDNSKMILVDSHQGVCLPRYENICDTIMISNKDSAARAAEVLWKLLPSGDSHVSFVEANGASCLGADLTIREKFLRRRECVRFKEKALSLKYRAFQRLWKENLRLLSLGTHRMKLQKKNDLNSRSTQSGNHMHRYSVRSRFPPPVGSLSQVPKPEFMSFTCKLLSDSPIKIYRSSLKMPVMILDEKEKMTSRFTSSNGLVEDPCAIEKERALINPWTVEEKEIFMDKLAIHGKDFSKIASFLDHKSTADCIEFYYKNHKSEWFEKIKRNPEVKKQGKPLSSDTYLVMSEKKWSREMNAASLDILGAASVIAAQADEAFKPSKLLSGKCSSRKSSGSNTILKASGSYYATEEERETAAADVLAGICGSLSSEAMSSCITSSVDPGEGKQESKQQTVGSSNKRSVTQDVTQNIDDDTCSDESCGEMDPVGWTDDEKSLFVEAYSSYGKDFARISRCVGTKSRDQCKVFFSKARKCLGLDSTQPGTAKGGIHASIDTNGGGSDAEDACIVETGSVVCSDKSGSRMDEDFRQTNREVSKPEAVTTEFNMMEEICGPGQLDHKDANTILLPNQATASRVARDDGLVHVQDIKSAAADDIANGGNRFSTKDEAPKLKCPMGVTDAEIAPLVPSVSVDPAATGFTNDKLIVRLENGVGVFSSPSDLGGFVDGCCHQSTSTENMRHSQSSSSLMNQIESSPIVRSFSLDMPIKVEMHGAAPCNIRSENEESRSFQNCYLRKCSRTSSHSAVAELPFLVKSKNRTDDHPESSCSLETEKPSKNGNVKLFGQILSKPCSPHKPVSAQDGDYKAKHHLTGDKIDMKLAAKQGMNGDSSGNHEEISLLGLENVPIKSYGFWDGTKIQTSFALSDSALLLSKYPTSFAGYAISSAKSDQQPLQAAVNVSECTMNGACVFSPREFNSCNGIIEYPVLRNQEVVQPFGLDTLADVQRNGFETTSSLPQQGKGSVQLNVVQGRDMIPGGGSCNGISDAVAAPNLHYAKTQQYVGGDEVNPGFREETWRGQGDLGR